MTAAFKATTSNQRTESPKKSPQKCAALHRHDLAAPFMGRSSVRLDIKLYRLSHFFAKSRNSPIKKTGEGKVHNTNSQPATHFSRRQQQLSNLEEPLSGGWGGGGCGTRLLHHFEPGENIPARRPTQPLRAPACTALLFQLFQRCSSYPANGRLKYLLVCPAVPRQCGAERLLQVTHSQQLLTAY